MKKDQITNLFSASFSCDKKHRLNTTAKTLPVGLLKELSSDGLTLERVDALLSEGYDIYRYQTQLTVHGVCKEVLPEIRFGYKTLTVNKNGSVGVRWVGVDRAKKLGIISVLKQFGWSGVSNSTDLHPQLSARHQTFKEAADTCLEYKKIMDRVDSTLFYGSYSIYVLQSPYFGFISVLDLYINGILEVNIPAVLEAIVGMSYTDIHKAVEAKKAAEKAKQEEYEAKWRAAREARKNAYAKSFQELAESLVADGYRKVQSNTLPVGTVFKEIRRSYSDDTAYVVTLLMCSRSAKKCDSSGKVSFDATPQTQYKRRPIMVWVHNS